VPNGVFPSDVPTKILRASLMPHAYYVSISTRLPLLYTDTSDMPGSKSCIQLSLLRYSRRNPLRPCVTFCNMLFSFRRGLLTFRTKPKLKDHLLLAVRHCLFYLLWSYSADQPETCLRRAMVTRDTLTMALSLYLCFIADHLLTKFSFRCLFRGIYNHT
jgi:hypothetical protein